jgi:hypothetical protein
VKVYCCLQGVYIVWFLPSQSCKSIDLCSHTLHSTHHFSCLLVCAEFRSERERIVSSRVVGTLFRTQAHSHTVLMSPAQNISISYNIFESPNCSLCTVVNLFYRHRRWTSKYSSSSVSELCYFCLLDMLAILSIC